LTPNQLTSEHGWKSFGDSGAFEYWVELGFKMPKLVEALPNKETWKEEWDALPYPQSCEDQGFFYNDDVCPNCGREIDGSRYCSGCDEYDDWEEEYDDEEEALY
jgi:hypothetical protein